MVKSSAPASSEKKVAVSKKPVQEVPNPTESSVMLPPKSHTELRGLTKYLLLRGLPPNTKIVHFKKSLPAPPSSVVINHKGGLCSAIVRYGSEEECSKAYDSLQSFVYVNHKVLPTFVRPRTIVEPSEPFQPSSTEFCLSVYNIPFFVTHEQLQAFFPKAEVILMRSRKDRTFKGSCVVVFKTEDDLKAAERTCEKSELEGRQLKSTRATPEACSELLSCVTAPSKEEPESLQVKLFNLPFSTDEAELKKAFPQARNIFLPKNKDGEPTGIAILTFKTKAICQAALARAEKMKLQNRQLRAQLNSPKEAAAPKGKGRKQRKHQRNVKGRPKTNRFNATKRRQSKGKGGQPLKKPKLNITEGDANSW